MKTPDQLLVLIDANSSGVSGDKYLGALVNMGGRVESLRKVAKVVAEYLPGTSDVELKELGSADTLIDVLGVARLSEELGLGEAAWWSTPVAVGGGTSHFSGRSYPNPPPAVAEILRAHKFPMVRGLGDRELSTPTGVAITVNLVGKQSQSHPAIRPQMVGYGAGSKDIDGVANVLRIMAGESLETPHSHDEMVILETNIDDVTGEILGRAVEILMSEGARDVTITPVYMKKNRPGHMITVIAKKDD